MALFRTGFKIFGQISLKQGLGRIRSFSEDRKPRQWLPEDQWAVRQPGSTCPDPCEKPKKPPKPSKSWLSICRDPPPKELECDVRHNNCPPPPKDDPPPWYSLENFISKKKSQEKLLPTQICREELKRREMHGEEEEVCENITEKCFPENLPPETCCMPKSEPSPAPVKTIACPLPKELDIMLWCERPCKCPKIPIICQSDRLPYEEFRPQKCWKPPPFSLPAKSEHSAVMSPCSPGPTPFSEFKHVDLPRPLYTRYKSVELSNENLMLCMTDVQCAEDEHAKLAITPLPPPVHFKQYPPPPPCDQPERPNCLEKPILEVASCKPVRIKKAPKYTFTPKPTKLIEKKVSKNPCAQHKTSNLLSSPQEKSNAKADVQSTECKDSDPPKVITGTLTDEPPKYERDTSVPSNPPKWMYTICKPGAKKTPLVPCTEEFAKEPDCSAEADGLKFYDGNDENIKPKPPSDPFVEAKAQAEKAKKLSEKLPEPEPVKKPQPVFQFKNRFVLMPDHYNIKPSYEECPQQEDDTMSHSFEKFLEKQSASMTKLSYPPMKENILYDLQRLCPNPPLDPSKLNVPSRKPPPPECPQPPRFYRSFSTLSPSALDKLCPSTILNTQIRSECGDSSGKCKVRNILPKRECQEAPPKPDCAEITLPCCPKARIPPDCDVRKGLPICKKKLPPKPSFSECSKDPPPCPRITECDCWEKVGKNRKYSDWAAQRAQSDLREVSKNTHRSSDTRGRSKYTSTVKCFTLQPAQEVRDASKNRMVLGLKDSNDSSCDYESRPIVTKKNRSKTRVQNIKIGHLLTSARESRLPQSRSYITTQEPFPKAKTNEVAVKQEIHNNNKYSTKTTTDEEHFPTEKFDNEKLDEDVSVTFYDPPERNEENSKAFMSTFGSWINDLFSAPNKISTPLEGEKFQVQKESVQEEDAEYLKSIRAIKEQFRKKLKSETSVQVSTPDRPFAFNFDKVSDKSNKTKKKARSLPETSSVDWLEELNQLDEKAAEVNKSLSVRHYNQNSTATGLIIKTDNKITGSKSSKKKKSVLNNSIFLKESKKKKNRNRRDLSELEEYIFPAPKELSKRVLSNISKEDKCGQFYKNSHLAVQEAQHYGKRKNKAYQSSARCYTTNANLIEESSNSKALAKSNKSSHFCTSSVSELKGAEEFSRKNSMEYKKYTSRKSSKKTVSDLTRDSMSFVKSLKNSKTGQFLSQEPLKSDSKTSSHDLVRYLIKKIKTTRPQAIKTTKGSPNVPQVLSSPKSRFMQSATNTLVLSAIAKKDSEVLPVKSSRAFPEPKLYPGKELIVRQAEHNLRIDVTRALGSNKFSKLSYLLENDHVDDDTLSLEQENYKSTRRPYEDALKREAKKIGKFNKRQEVKQELSNLDKLDILELPKPKPKEPKKKLDERIEINVEETREAQNARFQKQHQLFKTNLKHLHDGLESIPPLIETKNPLQELSQNDFALSTELAVIEPQPEPIPKTELVDQAKYLEASPDTTEPEFQEYLTVDEKPSASKVEKKPSEKSTVKDKMHKTKPTQFPKDSESKMVLDPLEKFCASEQQKEPPLSSTDLGPVDDVLLLNRRYSTNSLVEYAKKHRPSSWNSPSTRTTLCLDDLGDGDKKQMVRKKKKKSARLSRNSINQTTSDYPCGFEISKKNQPQPNCEDE